MNSTVRRLAALVALGVIGGGLAGCSSGEAASADKGSDPKAPLHKLLPKDLQNTDSITIASNVEYPPFEFFDTDNTTVLGIDREIADGLEKQLGIGIKFQNISFDAIIPGLVSNRYQMAMSAMTDNRERQKEVDFVDYFAAGAGVLTHENDADTYADITDLCGATVGIVKGTTEVPQADAQSAKCKAEGKQPINSIVFPGQNQAVLALQNNRVVAVLMDSAPGGYVASQTGGLAMSQPYESQPFGIVFTKGNTPLEHAVQQALEALRSNGDYEKALSKYGLEKSALKDFPINGGTQ